MTDYRALLALVFVVGVFVVLGEVLEAMLAR